jgi:hypothetical protein
LSAILNSNGKKRCCQNYAGLVHEASRPIESVLLKTMFNDFFISRYHFWNFDFNYHKDMIWIFGLSKIKKIPRLNWVWYAFDNDILNSKMKILTFLTQLRGRDMDKILAFWTLENNVFTEIYFLSSFYFILNRFCISIILFKFNPNMWYNVFSEPNARKKIN